VNDKVFSGNFSGSNNQFGDNSVQNVSSGISSSDLRDLIGLLGTLRSQIQNSGMPEATKTSLAQQVDTMDQAARSGDVKSGFTRALQGINEHLGEVGTATDRVSGIVSTLSKIAGIAGIAIKTVAPFVAGLL
jgi:hypothetical protein